jgi:putative aldouronate transport system substrate-binding protein
MQVSQGLIGINLLVNDGPDKATYPWKSADPQPPWSHFTAESFLLVTKEMYQSIQPGAQSVQRRPRQGMYAPVVNFGAIFPTIMPTAEESKRISELLPDLQSYVDQTQTKWIMQGGVNSEWDAYVQRLKTMKLDELLAIYQQQLDRYLKQ